MILILSWSFLFILKHCAQL